MNQYVWETAEEMDAALARRIRGIRKRRRLTQQDLSERSGVSLGTLKRFETTGQISLLSLTKLAIALGCENEIVQQLAPQDFPVLPALGHAALAHGHQQLHIVFDLQNRVLLSIEEN